MLTHRKQFRKLLAGDEQRRVFFLILLRDGEQFESCSLVGEHPIRAANDDGVRGRAAPPSRRRRAPLYRTRDRAVGGLRRPPGARHTLGGMSDRTSGIDPADVERVRELAEAARTASRRLALMSRAEKDAALRTLADDLEPPPTPSSRPTSATSPAAASTACRDSLRPPAPRRPRVAAVAQALRDIAALPDPVGEVVRGSHVRQRPADPQGGRPAGRHRHHLRVAAQRHRRRRGPLPEERQRRHPARRQRRCRHQPRHRRLLRDSSTRQGLPADAVGLLRAGPAPSAPC